MLKKILREKNSVNFILTLILACIVAGIQVSFSVCIKLLIDNGLNNNMDNVLRVAAIVLVLFILFYFLATMGYKFKNKYLKIAISNLNKSILNSIIYQKYSKFKKNKSSYYLSLLTNDMKVIEKDYLESEIIIFQEAMTLILILSLMIYYSVYLFLVTVIVLLLPLYISKRYNIKLSKTVENIFEKNKVFISKLNDLLKGFTVMKSYKMEESLFDSVNTASNNYLKTVEENKNLNDKVITLSNLSTFITISAVYFLGILLVINKMMSIGELVAFVQLLSFLIHPIQILPSAISKLNGCKTVLNEDFMKLIENNITSSNNTTDLAFFKNIKFDKVSYEYETGKQVLNDISFVIEKNKSYAIVGLSGSGKSTIVNILLKYFENYTGRISIDDTDIKDIDIGSLYKKISVIQQETFLFDTNLKDNITLLKKYDNLLIEEAIESSGLSKFVSQNGLNFLCSENGQKLSVGEKQRIAIARAILRNTEILIMDEATANLDNLMSYSIEKKIFEIDNVTKIVILHKYHSEIIKKFDEIIVLDSGNIVEIGSFSKLIENKGLFYRLYNISNSGTI